MNQFRCSIKLRRARCAVVVIALALCAGKAAAKDLPEWPATEPTATSLKDMKKGPAGLRIKEEGFRGLYTMNRDGSDVEFLVAAPGMLINTDAQYSHDGKWVTFNAFPKLQSPVLAKLFVVRSENAMTGELRDFGFGMEPAFSPDDKQIAYAINPGTPIGAEAGIWVMNIDGSHRRWLALDYFPRWSPDGKQLVYHMYGPHGSTLATVDVESCKTQDLLADSGWTVNLYSGAWSADGKQIAFVGQHEGRDRLAILDLKAEKEPIHVLCTSDDKQTAFQGPPAWSPDGKQLVFMIQDAEGRRQWWNSYLCSMAAEVPSAPVYLESERVGNINRSPAFSPDSKKILFSSER